VKLIHYNNTLQIKEPSVVTVGSFDGVHLGHQALLQQVKDYAQQNLYQSVIVTFNPHPQEVLKNKPDFFLINTFEQKIALFEKLGMDTVLVIPFSPEFSQKSANQFFKEYIFSTINLKALFLGPNHHFGKHRKGDVDTLSHICEKNKIELFKTQEFTVNNVPVRSTLIRQYLAQKDFQNAEKLMGHHCYILPT